MFLCSLPQAKVHYHIPGGAQVKIPPNSWTDEDETFRGSFKQAWGDEGAAASAAKVFVEDYDDEARAINDSFEAFSRGGDNVATVVAVDRPAAYVTLPYDQVVEWLFNQALQAHCHNRAPMSIPVYFTFEAIKASAPDFDPDDAVQVTALVRDKVRAMISAIFTDKYRKRPMALAQLADYFRNTDRSNTSQFIMHAVDKNCNSCSADYTSLMQFPLNYLNCGYLWRTTTSTTTRTMSEFSGITRCSPCYQQWLVDNVTSQIMAMWRLTSWIGSTATVEQLETRVDWSLNFVDCIGRRVCLWCIDWINPDQNALAIARAAVRKSGPISSSYYEMFPSLPMTTPFQEMHSFTSAMHVPFQAEKRYESTLYNENRALRAQNHRLQEQLSLLLSLHPTEAAALAADRMMPPLINSVAPRIPSHSVDPDTMSDRHAVIQTESEAFLCELFSANSMDPPDYQILRAIEATRREDRAHHAPSSKINYTGEAIDLGITRPGPVQLRGGGHNVKGNGVYAAKIASRKNKIFTLTYTIDDKPYTTPFVYIQFSGKAKPIVTDSEAYDRWVESGYKDIADDKGSTTYNLLTGRVNSLRNQQVTRIFNALKKTGRVQCRDDIPPERTAISNARINGVEVDWSLIRDNINEPEGLDRFCAELPDLPPMAECSASTNRILQNIAKKVTAKNKKRPASTDDDDDNAPIKPPVMFSQPNVSSGVKAAAAAAAGDARKRLTAVIGNNASRSGGGLIKKVHFNALGSN